MKITTSSTPTKKIKADALIIFYLDGKPLLPDGEETLRDSLKQALEHSAFKGETGQTACLPSPEGFSVKQLITTGMGKLKNFYPGVLEKAAATATRSGSAAGFSKYAAFTTMPLEPIEASNAHRLIGRGAAWGTYSFNTFKSDAVKKTTPSLTFSGTLENRSGIRSASAQGPALLNTADLANLPGNEAPPEKIASWARAMARRNGLTCSIMSKTELTRKGCGGILSVARGSARDPRMIILKHAGTRKNSKPLVLVGKTVTFDSGGISLKPGKDMGWMRYDKCGGMAVLAAMQMIARMKVKVPVVGILGAAENMPGSRATRPGDIIKAYKGKTIEVLNTDAEGRLVLADALGLAADLNPQAIVDVATLTGAVIGALGSAAAGILGNDQPLVDELMSAGHDSGERLWQLPLYKEYTDDMKSDFADLSNLCKSGTAGTATAAAFLQEFVPEEIPWAHLDIAGTAWLTSAKPYQAPGATLFGARLLTDWAAAR